MDGTDIFGTQFLHVLDDVPVVLQDGLPLIEDGNAVALDLLQQFQVACSIQGCVDADHDTMCLGSLTDVVEAVDNLLTLRLIGRPVVTASA